MIQYEEFLRTFIGQMPRFWYELVLKAFRRLDQYGEGAVSLQDIFTAYNPNRHPDVAMGKISSEDESINF